MSQKEKAIQFITETLQQPYYLNRGLSENTIYKIFRNFITDTDYAIQSAREYLENQEKLGNVETTVKPLFPKSAFIKK
jgi:hypothetical protein